MNLMDNVNRIIAELEYYYRVTGDPIYYDACQLIKHLLEIIDTDKRIDI